MTHRTSSALHASVVKSVLQLPIGRSPRIGDLTPGSLGIITINSYLSHHIHRATLIAYFRNLRLLFGPIIIHTFACLISLMLSGNFDIRSIYLLAHSSVGLIVLTSSFSVILFLLLTASARHLNPIIFYIHFAVKFSISFALFVQLLHNLPSSLCRTVTSFSHFTVFNCFRLVATQNFFTFSFTFHSICYEPFGFFLVCEQVSLDTCSLK